MFSREKIAEIQKILQSRQEAVLTAPPGTGKTVGIPPALLPAPWLEGQSILILEPRRAAARNAARYAAELQGEAPGDTIGYRIRGETRVSGKTRLEYVTEGVLTRLLMDDPSLQTYGLIIFDEFHERSLAADTGLALALHCRELFRPDLRLLLMSATLDTHTYADFLGGEDPAPIISAGTPPYPVETHYAGHRPEFRRGTWTAALVELVLRAWREGEGSLLVFLPGKGELAEAQALLQHRQELRDIPVQPLHGALPFPKQKKILHSKPQKRRIILATSIAESSLTVPGITAVVDGGLSRRRRFDPAAGMSRMETRPLSAASAEQRRGRAGRTAPGSCYRLWAREEALPSRDNPEILDADPAPLLLTLAVWGVTDPGEIPWLTPPPEAPLARARSLLIQLGAVTSQGRPTALGKRMEPLGLHPRTARMVLQAPAGKESTALALAALLEFGGRLPRKDGSSSPAAGSSLDLRDRLDDLRLRPPQPLLQEMEFILRRLPADRKALIPPSPSALLKDLQPEDAGPLTALAYPDRIGRRQQNPGEYLLSGGRAARTPPGTAWGDPPWIAAAETDAGSVQGRIRTAAPVTKDELLALFHAQIRSTLEARWTGSRLRFLQCRRLPPSHSSPGLSLDETPANPPPPSRLGPILAETVSREGLSILPWNKKTRNFRQRAYYYAALPQSPFPAQEPNPFSQEALLRRTGCWLAPFITSPDPGRIPLMEALKNLLGFQNMEDMNRQCPETVQVPSGSRIPLNYSGDKPSLAVQIQEIFGWKEPPIPLQLRLLSPAGRPVQITEDLPGFWEHTWPEVRKELSGRYPKHPWPENPIKAPPATRGGRTIET